MAKKSYLAVKTQLKTYLFEMEGESGLSKAKKGPFSMFDSKSKAIEWLEGTGLPIEIASTKIKAPLSQMQMCIQQQGIKKVRQKQ